jgi:hypothetical protein
MNNPKPTTLTTKQIAIQVVYNGNGNVHLKNYMDTHKTPSNTESGSNNQEDSLIPLPHQEFHSDNSSRDSSNSDLNPDIGKAVTETSTNNMEKTPTKISRKYDPKPNTATPEQNKPMLFH